MKSFWAMYFLMGLSIGLGVWMSDHASKLSALERFAVSVVGGIGWPMLMSITTFESLNAARRERERANG